jgi:hypothetical protein
MVKFRHGPSQIYKSGWCCFEIMYAIRAKPQQNFRFAPNPANDYPIEKGCPSTSLWLINKQASQLGIGFKDKHPVVIAKSV